MPGPEKPPDTAPPTRSDPGSGPGQQADDPSVPAGRLGDFELLREIGRGGMGIVYEARQLSLDRRVALKVLPREAVSDPERLHRFEREAKILAGLDHPNLVTVHTVESVEGTHFITMELVRGQPLSEQIPRQGLPLDRFLDLAIPLADALSTAHENGVVHRDLKPANVMVSDEGRIKVLDFGLAKLRPQPSAMDGTRLPTESTALTRGGKVLGTFPYMSPEQIEGKPVDHRSDIFALGIMLFEMITGHRPFQGETPAALMSSILRDEAPTVNKIRADLPADLPRIIRHCLQKDPERRYQTAKGLRNELEELRRDTMPASGASALAARTTAPVRSRTMWLGFGILALIGLVVVLAYLLWPHPPDTVPEPKRIVVLPFENLGPVEDAYFAAGMTEEITARLAAVRGLGVISRTSAIHYDTTGKSVREIGADFEVDYVLEGTVRWDRPEGGPGLIRITPQLIRVSDDTHLWAHPFDGVHEDVFQLQSQIAREVIDRLEVTLLAPEQGAIEMRPTGNLDAYHAYLRGQHYTSLSHFSVAPWLQAIECYGRAVSLDPGFTLAHLELSMAHATLYYYQVDTSTQRRELSRTALEKATALDSDLPQVHLARGYYHLWTERDAGRALEEFAIAGRGLPGSAQVLAARADALRLQGAWPDALASYREAVRLSPRDTSFVVEEALTCWWMRRYPEALEASNRAIGYAPDQVWPYLAKVFNDWSWTGGRKEARAALEAAPPLDVFTPWTWYWQAILEGRYGEAVEHLEDAPGEWIHLKIGARPKALFTAWAREWLGDREGAGRYYETAIGLLEAQVRSHPDDPRYHSSLGIAYAAQGRREEAIREGERAIALLPLSKDAVYGIPYPIDLAHIYTLLGEPEAALDEIETLLAIPSWISVPFLEADPRWGPLRDHPRYRVLLEEYGVDR